MKLNAYLNFNGQCAAAFKFYEKCLGGRIDMIQTFGESPAKDHMPAEWHDKVIHVRLLVGDQVLMGSDAPPPHFAAAQGMSVSIGVTSPEEAKRIFDDLAQGGRITMPFEKTFWSPGFGMVVDRFGTPWMVNCEPPSAT
jgi:PhnB protein